MASLGNIHGINRGKVMRKSFVLILVLAVAIGAYQLPGSALVIMLGIAMFCTTMALVSSFSNYLVSRLSRQSATAPQERKS